MSDHLRVLIGIPSGGVWHAQFGVDLVSMVARFNMQKIPGYRTQELRVANVKSSILPKNRLDICKMAEQSHAHYVLMLDTDHTFPSDLLHRMIARGKGILAANCVTKTLPANPTAKTFNGTPEGATVYTDPTSTGVQEVWRVGTGVMLIRGDVLKKVPHSGWAMKYIPEHDTFQGEDWSWCEAAQAVGEKIWIDHDISKQIGHVGNLEYTHQYVGEISREAVA